MCWSYCTEKATRVFQQDNISEIYIYIYIYIFFYHISYHIFSSFTIVPIIAFISSKYFLTAYSYSLYFENGSHSKTQDIPTITSPFLTLSPSHHHHHHQRSLVMNFG